MLPTRSSENTRRDIGGTFRARINFKIQKYVLFSMGAVLMLMGFCLYAAGAIDLLRTTVFWLRTGRWEALVTSAVIGRLPGPSNLLLWVEKPSDWIGLHTAVEAVFLRWPWFAASMVYGMASLLCGGSLFLRVEDAEQAWIQRK